MKLIVSLGFLVSAITVAMATSGPTDLSYDSFSKEPLQKWLEVLKSDPELDVAKKYAKSIEKRRNLKDSKVKSCAKELRDEDIQLVMVQSCSFNDEGDLKHSASISDFNGINIWYHIGKGGTCGRIEIRATKETSPHDSKWELMTAFYGKKHWDQDECNGPINIEQVKITPEEALDVARKLYQKETKVELETFYFIFLENWDDKLNYGYANTFPLFGQPVYRISYINGIEGDGIYVGAVDGKAAWMAPDQGQPKLDPYY